MIKSHFPYAVAALAIALLAAGLISLGILAIAFGLALVPIIYAREVNEVGVHDDDRRSK